MSNTIIIHSRLYKVDGVCYADEVVISQAEFDQLVDHYHTLVDALARPWKEKDACYDSTGRYNDGGQSAYEDRV